MFSRKDVKFEEKTITGAFGIGEDIDAGIEAIKNKSLGDWGTVALFMALKAHTFDNSGILYVVGMISNSDEDGISAVEFGCGFADMIKEDKLAQFASIVSSVIKEGSDE